MRFDLDQIVPGPAAVVERAFADPSFYGRLDGLRDLRVSDVQDPERTDRGVVVEARYRFTGPVVAAARRFVDPGSLSWTVRAETLAELHRTEFVLRAEGHLDRLSLTFSYRFEAAADGPDGPLTRQRVQGDLRVRVPLVGPVAERAMVGGLKEHFAAEAQVLAAWAAEQELDPG